MFFYNTDEDNLLIGRVGARCGCITFLQSKCWATDNALVLHTNMNLKYTYYLLCGANLNDLNTSNAQPLITGAKVKSLIIPLSPIAEQTAIAQHLDKKCIKIDEFIALQEQMIAQLTIYKQAVITETVTKGLNPNVKMKGSGVEWIGEIPEHWEVKRIKNVCKNY